MSGGSVDPARMWSLRLASARTRIRRGDRLGTSAGMGTATSKPTRRRGGTTTVRVRLDAGRSRHFFDHEVWPEGWDS